MTRPRLERSARPLRWIVEGTHLLPEVRAVRGGQRQHRVAGSHRKEGPGCTVPKARGGLCLLLEAKAADPGAAGLYGANGHRRVRTSSQRSGRTVP